MIERVKAHKEWLQAGDNAIVVIAENYLYEIIFDELKNYPTMDGPINLMEDIHLFVIRFKKDSEPFKKGNTIYFGGYPWRDGDNPRKGGYVSRKTREWLLMEAGKAVGSNRRRILRETENAS